MSNRRTVLGVGVALALGCVLFVVPTLQARERDECGACGRPGPLHYVQPTFAGTVKVAAAQTSPLMFDNAYNLAVMLARLDEAAQNGASLVAFPELSLTAYKYADSGEAMQYAEQVPGPSTDQMAARAGERGVYAVFGLLEKEGRDVFDTVVLVGPEGYIGKYRKIHEGFQSESLVFTRGTEPPPVFATTIGRIGLADCYDGAFPETARLLALQGADIMVFIYNESGAVWRDYVLSRATESNAFVVAPNRIGAERFSSFNGGSFIGAPGFQILASAGAAAEQIIYADLDLGLLGDAPYAHRRPELYGALAEPYAEQILSADATPQSHVTGNPQNVAVTIVTASLRRGTPVAIELKGESGVAVARIEGRLGCNRQRFILPVSAAVPAGAYTVAVEAGWRSPETMTLPYTVKPVQKPVALGKLPVGAGSANKGTIYVSFDLNVATSTRVPVQLVGDTSTTTLYGTINNAGTDNRLSASYPTLPYGAAYTVIIPAGSVHALDYPTTNDEVRFDFVVQPAPLVVKAAAVQTSPERSNVPFNLTTLQAKLSEAAAAGAKLVVFPEFALTGSGFMSASEAAAAAEPVPGPSVDAIVATAQELGVYVAFGMLERESHRRPHGRSHPDLFSTMVLAGPEGLVGKYRKTHLGATGDDRFLSEGATASPVFQTTLGPLGLAAGNDVYYPEPSRSLFLRGALIVAAGQNDAGTLWAELARTRASENKVYVIAANRVGVEEDRTYEGSSIMAATSRKVLVQATKNLEQIIYADLNMYDITKRVYQYIDRPTGKVKATDYSFDRSPELYEPLAWHPRFSRPAPCHHAFERFRHTQVRPDGHGEPGNE